MVGDRIGRHEAENAARRRLLAPAGLFTGLAAAMALLGWNRCRKCEQHGERGNDTMNLQTDILLGPPTVYLGRQSDPQNSTPIDRGEPGDWAELHTKNLSKSDLKVKA